MNEFINSFYHVKLFVMLYVKQNDDAAIFIHHYYVLVYSDFVLYEESQNQIHKKIFRCKK